MIEGLNECCFMGASTLSMIAEKYDICCVKKGLNVSAKSIISGQPASGQADLVRNIQLGNFSTCYPITRRQIFDSSKLKKFADDFKFYKNGRKLSIWVENPVGKGEIARYEQFLLFPQCFQKACFPGASKGVIVWEWVKGPFYPRNELLVSQSRFYGALIRQKKNSCVSGDPTDPTKWPMYGKL